MPQSHLSKALAKLKTPSAKDSSGKPLDELESLLETAHLLRSTKNAQRLLTALTRARTESVKPITVADLQKQVGFDA